MKIVYVIMFLAMGLLFYQCDIKKSDLENEKSFIHIYHDNNINNEYYPLDIVELNDGFLILATKMLNSDTTNFDWNNQKPFVIKTDIEGNIEWSITGDDPYVSPIADILNVNGGYYFFALHKTSLAATLFEINVQSHTFVQTASGDFGDNAYALRAIVDKEGNIVLLSSDKQGTKNSKVYKISGSGFNIIWTVDFTNSANDGENVIIPAVLEQLSYHGQQYPYSIKQLSDNNGNLTAYLVNCYNNTQLSLNSINADGSNARNIVAGSRNSTFIATFEQVNDSVVAIAKNDHNEISIQTDFVINGETRLGIEDITETTTFKELDGVSLLLSGIFTYGDQKYLLFAGATKGEQIAVFVYNTDDYTIKNIYYLGSSNDIHPVAFKPTSDDGILILCKTLVTNKYLRIAMYKLPLEEIGL